MKKYFKLIILAIAVVSVMSCENKKEEAVIIGKQNPVISDSLLSPEVLWSLGRVGGIDISPDGKKFLYTVTYYSVPEDKGNTELFVMNVDGSGKKQLTWNGNKKSGFKWMNDGEHIAFLSDESGSMQLWMMKVDGTGKKQLTDREGGINAFRFSPDETKLLFIADVKQGERTVDKYPDLPKAGGIIVTDLMYKHWDEWKQTVPHPFIADFKGNRVSGEKDLLDGEPYESPMKPFGGIEQLAWSPDGSLIAYTCRKKTGKEYAVSTNSDIYFYEVKTGVTRNVTEGMMGYDVNPVFSPDGQWLAWESMERDGYESDKNRLFIMNVNSGEKRDLSVGFDQNVGSLVWADDNKTIYFVSNWQAKTQIYKADIVTGEINSVTQGTHDYQVAYPVGGRLIALRQSMSAPSEIYSVDVATGEAIELSYENKDIMAQLKMGQVEERWIKTIDNKQMLAWVIFPPDFDSSKKYPILLYCQGGPQSGVSQFWSYRWNFQLMAANGYIIVAPNRRGVLGFGEEWKEQISGDYGGQNMKDYLSAIDEVAKEAYVDKEHLGCVGASYGGFSVFWLAGHHEKRFKAFIAHDGFFNMEQQYLETEEMWFANWDLGGPYWDKENKTVKKSYANSPHLFVDKWDTPILVIHGEKDYRILASQGMAAFNAAVLRGVPAELLVFPDENHWVTKPQNSILWQRTFFDWLDKWLK